MKQTYISPQISLVYLEPERILFASGDPTSKYDPENDPDAGAWIG